MKHIAIVVGLLSILLARETTSAPIPVLNLNDLTANADIVAVGTISSIFDAGPWSAVDRGRLLVGDVIVDRVLKGEAIASIRFEASVPNEDGASRLPPPDRYRMFFLKHVGDHYEFVSRYYPSVAAAALTSSNYSVAIDRVAEAVVAVATSASSGRAAKIDAIHTLWNVKSSAAIVGLRSALQQEDIAVRLTAAAALLRSDDVSGCSVAEPALLGQMRDISSEILQNLRSAIESGLKDPVSIPFLSRLLHAESVESRRAAAAALRHTSSQLALRPLAEALEDADSDVTFSVVMGLAEITGNRNRGVSHPAFLLNPNLYISYWKNWALGRF